MDDVDLAWMRDEAKRQGLKLTEDDLEAMRTPLSRVKTLLRAIRTGVDEGTEPAIQYRLEPPRGAREGGDR
jgi:hypothetical protein